MRYLPALAAVALLLSATCAIAATGFGFGSKTCADFMAASKGVPAGKFKIRDVSAADYYSANTAYIQWAQGFISGVRYGQAPTGSKRITGSAFDGDLRSYCAAHPNELFVNAAENIAKREGVLGK